MALTRFHIKQHDRLPPLVATLRVKGGDPINLTGKTVRFTMRRGALPPKVDRAGVDIVDAAGGEVQYNWGAQDTDESGTFEGEFEITDAGGKKQTVPNDGNCTIVITDDLDEA